MTAKKRVALTRTTRALGKLTALQRFTGAFSLAGAAWSAAVSCSTSFLSVAACFLTFCLVPASFTAADVFTFCSALFASLFASALFALLFNSFAASSDSLLWLMKALGMVNMTPLLLVWTSSSCKAGRGLTKGNAASRARLHEARRGDR